MHTCTYAYIYIYIYIYIIYIYIHICIYIHIYIHKYLGFMQYIYLFTLPKPYVCLSTYIHASIYVCRQAYITSVLKDFQISRFLEFPYFQKYGNLEILELWKSFLMSLNIFISAEQIIQPAFYFFIKFVSTAAIPVLIETSTSCMHMYPCDMHIYFCSIFIVTYFISLADTSAELKGSEMCSCTHSCYYMWRHIAWCECCMLDHWS